MGSAKYHFLKSHVIANCRIKKIMLCSSLEVISKFIPIDRNGYTTEIILFLQTLVENSYSAEFNDIQHVVVIDSGDNSSLPAKLQQKIFM